ncbi:hypothetical protein VIGAN_08002900, partial [Vigna angularis var. angularis]
VAFFIITAVCNYIFYSFPLPFSLCSSLSLHHSLQLIRIQFTLNHLPPLYTCIYILLSNQILQIMTYDAVSFFNERRKMQTN